MLSKLVLAGLLVSPPGFAKEVDRVTERDGLKVVTRIRTLTTGASSTGWYEARARSWVEFYPRGEEARWPVKKGLPQTSRRIGISYDNAAQLMKDGLDQSTDWAALERESYDVDSWETIVWRVIDVVPQGVENRAKVPDTAPQNGFFQ